MKYLACARHRVTFLSNTGPEVSPRMRDEQCLNRETAEVKGFEGGIATSVSIQIRRERDTLACAGWEERVGETGLAFWSSHPVPSARGWEDCKGAEQDLAQRSCPAVEG